MMSTATAAFFESGHDGESDETSAPSISASGGGCCRSASRVALGNGTNLTEPGTRLITLGTLAGPFPNPLRAQSSNLLIVNGTSYVVDAGDGVVRRLAQAGVSIREIGTIFITHGHDDHTAGLGTLMSVAWDFNRTEPINAYGPPGTEALVKAAVQYFTMSSELRISDGGRVSSDCSGVLRSRRWNGRYLPG